MNLVVTLMKPRKASLRDADLERSMKELNLDKAAYRWDWLTNSLEMGTRECPEDGPLAIDPTLRQLVTNVRQMLDAAREAACMIHPEQTEAMREHCAVNRGEDAKSYSWIPLICEMATNLSTTLWVKGFRWYEPNQLAEQRIIKTGQIGRAHV